jgi:hypothetical protein
MLRHAIPYDCQLARWRQLSHPAWMAQESSPPADRTTGSRCPQGMGAISVCQQIFPFWFGVRDPPLDEREHELQWVSCPSIAI